MTTSCIQNVFKSALLLSRPWVPFTCPVRWNRYSSLYLKPTLDKEELAQPLPEDDLRRYQPIQAATNEESTSFNYDPLVQKFMRMLVKEGKRETARTIVEKTFAQIKLLQIERFNKATSDEARADIELDPHVIFRDAVDNCRPLLITQRVKRGGVIYQVPIPVKPNYQTFKAMRWIIDSACDKDDQMRLWIKMAYELLEASNNEGKSVRKKQELHKLCEANRAYAHFRW